MHPRFSLDEINKIRAKLYGMKIDSKQLDNLLGENRGIFYAFMRKNVITDKEGEKELNELIEKIEEENNWENTEFMREISIKWWKNCAKNLLRNKII